MTDSTGTAADPHDNEIPDDSVPLPEDYDASAELAPPAPVNSLHRSPKPWHRPRKQYVRRQQWNTSLTKLIRDHSIENEVTYLGLPGDEFLDVRYLAGGPVSNAGINLRFFGFNTSDEAMSAPIDGSGRVDAVDSPAIVGELSALDATRNHPNVNALSDIQPDDIRRLGNTESPAFIRLSSLGPFDVVNLDLTQSLFARESRHGNYLAAVRELLGLQARAPREWLLWLTTRMDRQAVQDDHQSNLASLVMERFEKCPELEDLWTAEHFDARTPSDFDLDSCTERDFAAVMFLGMSLWLYGLGKSPVVQVMTVQSLFKYTVRDDGASPDMFSLVVKVSPKSLTPVDPSRFTPNKKRDRGPTACDQFAQLIGRHRNGIDIDARIINDPDLKDELVNETAELLRVLNISAADYHKWVSDYES